MSAPTTCACPQSNARDCYRFRHRIDLVEMIDHCEVVDDDECVCVCHDDCPANEGVGDA